MTKRLFIPVLTVVALAIAAGTYAVAFITDEDEAVASSHASLSASAALAPAGVASTSSTNYDLSAHQTLSRVIILIKENYVDPSRIRPYEMFLAALDYIEKTVAEVIVDDSEAPKKIRVAVRKAEHTFDLERLGGLDQLWEVTLALRDIFRFLQLHIEDGEKRRDIEYAAINGMLSTLDPHSVLLKPESFDEVRLSTKGEFGGLGIVISIRDASLTVISPIEDTPASRSGLKAQDQIVKINDESTVNMSLEEAVQRLRGKPGSKVTIWIKRKKWTEAKRFVLTRAVIKIKSVTSELLADGIGYVRIKSFQQNTFDDLHQHLEGLRNKNRDGLKGLVLDLRNNPGGLLDQAILISDRFIDRGALVITVGEGNRKRDVKNAHGPGTESKYPIAVLVNGGSASASEIVSGAIKNHDRGIVIGQQTFGKGSVQVLYDFTDRSALKLTIAQYLTPGDISIQSMGIAPDIEVVHASVSDKNVHLFVHDDAPREKDLDRHLETPTVVRRSTGATEGSVEDAIAGKGAIRIVHLAAEETEDGDAAAEAEAAAAAADKFRMDFEIELAHEILSSAKSGDRKKMLEDSAPLLRERASEEEARISEKLSALGVDWSTGSKPSSGTVEATIAVVPVKKKKGPVVAGDEMKLIGTVKNVGQESLFRVYGVTESDNPLLGNVEMAFGKLAPGEERSWTADVKIPQDMASRADEVKLVIGDMHDLLEQSSATALLKIDEETKPRFSFRFDVDDSKGGNGDGLLQIGERVTLHVTAKNEGPGIAGEALLAAKNLSHGLVSLDQGRGRFGELKPGAEGQAELAFSIREPSRRVQREEGDFSHGKLRVTVWDSILGEAVSEVISLPVAEPEKLKREKRSLKVQGTGLDIFAGANDSTRVLARAKSGAVLRSDATTDGWRRVEFRKGATGFVKDDAVKVMKGGKATLNQVQLAPAIEAPQISLVLDDLVTGSSTVRITGSIVDRQRVKDVFVFVNDKKVYYQSFEDVAPSDGEVKAALDVTVPLKEGSNAVAIVARESEDLLSRRVFGVFRGTDAVAERAKKRDTVAR